MPRKRAARWFNGAGDKIAAVGVSGFKSIVQRQQVEFRPLTILAGANNSGKSSMMQPLLLLKQTLDSQFDPGALLLDGPNVRITSVEQFVPRLKGEIDGGPLSIDFRLAGGATLTLSFGAAPGRKLDLNSMTLVAEDGREARLRVGMPGSQITQLLHVIFPPEVRQVLESVYPLGEWAVVRDRCFLTTEVTEHGSSSLLGGSAFPPVAAVRAFVERVLHLPGHRGNPERLYPTTAVGRSFPGTFEKYVASVVTQWQVTRDGAKLSALGDALEYLGLTWKVKAKQIDDTRVEIRVGRLPHGRRGGAEDLVSIADVGFGVSQTLPVVVALLVAGRGDTVYIEQPEIHLHPNAQARMGKVLCDAANRGVTVIAETHSSLLLREVQTLVAQGHLSPDLVKLHWFQQSAETGSTEVISASLDERGTLGDWPVDFDEVALQSEQRFLDAAEHRSIQ